MWNTERAVCRIGFCVSILSIALDSSSSYSLCSMLNQDLKKLHAGTPELTDVCPITPASLGSSISFIVAGACAYAVVARELFTSNARGNGHTIPIYLYLKLALPVWCVAYAVSLCFDCSISLTLPHPLYLVTIAVVSPHSAAASAHRCQVPRNRDGHLLC